MKKRLFVLLLAAGMLVGCSRQPGKEPAITPQKTELSASVPAAEPMDTKELFSDRDYEGTYDAAEAIRITLNGSTAACSDSAVKIADSTVTITDGGIYLLSGTLDNGMIIVDADKAHKVQLVLENAAIHSETCAAIYIRQADKVFLTLTGENSLSNGGSFTAVDENNIDAVIFSKDDLTINGEGTLQITSPAGHGIVSKDALTVTGGCFEIQAASHGITGQDSVSIDGATMTITAGKDAIQADGEEDTTKGLVYIAKGSLALTAEGDGISASSQMQIDGGTFHIVTGGGSANAEVKVSENWGAFGGMGGKPGDMGEKPGGMGGRPGGMGGFGDPGATETQEDSASIKGIKAALNLVINDGSFTVDCADDALHSNAGLTVNGGNFVIATGDDGFHADETLSINAGSITISQSYEGLEGLCILLAGGNITLSSGDDGLNAAGGNDQSGFGGHRGGDMFGAGSNSYIIISGGTLFVDADGDGIDSNGNLTITGGNITVEGPTNGGNGSLDYGGTGTISGGTVIVTGSLQMAQSLVGDGQGVLGVSVGDQQGGTAFEILDADGNIVLSAQPQKTYSCIVASSPQIRSGETYTLVIGGLSGEIQAQ